MAHGPLAIAWLSPAALVSFAPNALVGGVVLSLAANIAAFFAFSLTRQPSALERAQASAFAGVGVGGKPQAFRLWRSSTTAGELEAAVARYLGAGRARRAFAGFMRERGLVYDPALEASAQLIRHAEFLLSPAIGASTSRQVLSLLLRPRTVSGQSALKLIDEASAAIQSSRDQLQHALDHARQGITVFDANLALTAWNREFADLFDLPPAMLRHGVGLDEIVRFNAGRGAYGPGDSEDFVAERVASLLYDDQPNRLRLFSTHRVIEVRSARLPDGGIVTTYTDVTQTVQVEEALEAANEMLERRVDERTAELQRLNAELERAKNEADAANLSKTRFLAAASHDILQPLNAARLYASSLSEGASQIGVEERADLARNVDVSLEAVEEILGALLDISRLDAGATRPEISDVPVADLMGMLEIEFAALARAKGLDLIFVPTRLAVRTDRRLMRRLLQNLISNALKYTLSGRVLVGCRRVRGAARIEVWDTGLGIPPEQQRAVFAEFRRLDQGARVARGLGPRLVDRRAPGAGARASGRLALAPRQGLGVLRHRAARTRGARSRARSPARPSRSRRANRSTGSRFWRSTTSRGCSRACAFSSSDGVAWSPPPTALTRRGRRSPNSARRTSSSPTTISIRATASPRSGRCASASAAAFPRSSPPPIEAPRSATQAAREDVLVMNKPLKPAPLRAQLTRYSAMREAAE